MSMMLKQPPTRALQKTTAGPMERQEHAPPPTANEANDNDSNNRIGHAKTKRDCNPPGKIDRKRKRPESHLLRHQTRVKTEGDQDEDNHTWGNDFGPEPFARRSRRAIGNHKNAFQEQEARIATLLCHETQSLKSWEIGNLSRMGIDSIDVAAIPSIITSIAYVALEETIKQVKHVPQGEEWESCFPPLVVSKLLPSFYLKRKGKGDNRGDNHSRAGDFFESRNANNMQDSRAAATLSEMDEVKRLKSLNIPTWPLEEDFPLAYDWGPSTSVGLGSRTGSVACNHLLVQLAVAQIGNIGDDDLLSTLERCQVPQLSAVQFLEAIEGSIPELPPLEPPPFRWQGSHQSSNQNGHVPLHVATKFGKLFDTIQQKECQARIDAYRSKCELMAPDELRECLKNLNEYASELGQRWERLKSSDVAPSSAGNNSTADGPSRVRNSAAADDKNGGDVLQDSDLEWRKFPATAKEWNDTVIDQLNARGINLEAFDRPQDQL